MLGYRKVPDSFLKESDGRLALSQDYTSANLMPEFAMLSPDGTQIGNWMKCKDYIQDVIWGTKNKAKYSIHGWNFTPGQHELSNRYILLAMRWKDKSDEALSTNLKNVKMTVENIEKRLGFPLFQRTRFSKVIKGKDPYFVVYGSSIWLRCVGTVSFLAWLLRSSFTNEGHTLESIDKQKCPVAKDNYYFRGGAQFIEQLMGHGVESFAPDWGGTTVITVHNSGFCAYSAKIRQKAYSLKNQTKVPKTIKIGNLQ